MSLSKASAIVLAVFIASAGSAPAAIISGNYCSVAQIQDFPAGVVPADNWNDYTGPAGFGAAATVTSAAGQILYDDGSPVADGLALSWDVFPSGAQNTNDGVLRPAPPATLGADIDDGHDQLMTGYLQVSRLSSATPILYFSGSGLDTVYDQYDLYFYLDGDDDVQPGSSVAQNNQYSVTVWDTSAKGALLASAVYGRDAGTYALANDGSNPLAEYVQVVSNDPNAPTEGNYVQISGLTSSTFYVEIEGVAGGTAGDLNDGGHGVGLNGFQLVPEPATMSLLAVGALALIRRRR